MKRGKSKAVDIVTRDLRDLLYMKYVRMIYFSELLDDYKEEARLLWKALDAIQTTEQTLCLLVLKKSSVWKNLPKEVKHLVRQYVVHQDQWEVPGMAQSTSHGHAKYEWVIQAPPGYLNSFGAIKQ